jgi:hypothetical protein
MKSIIILLALCFLSFPVLSQSRINTELQKKITLMAIEDQKWRKESENIENGKTSAYGKATIDYNWRKTDSLNLIEAKSIIKKYGYPGYDLVGESGSNRFWTIVQHCDDDVKFQQQVLLLMSKQVKLNNASGEDFAYLQDRVLLSTNKKQIYGTQVRYNPTTKTAKPFPVQDSINVDKRRKAVGLTPLNEYLKIFDKN